MSQMIFLKKLKEILTSSLATNITLINKEQ